MERKGQAVIEFFLTYGWAILAAIIAIGVLYYFGVFSPRTYDEKDYNRYCSTLCEHYNMTCNSQDFGESYCYRLVNDTIVEKRELDYINNIYVFSK